MQRSPSPAAPAAAPPAAAAPAPLRPVTIGAPIVRQSEGTFNGQRIAYRDAHRAVDIDHLAGLPAARLVVTSYAARC